MKTNLIIGFAFLVLVGILIFHLTSQIESAETICEKFRMKSIDRGSCIDSDGQVHSIVRVYNGDTGKFQGYELTCPAEGECPHNGVRRCS